MQRRGRREVRQIDALGAAPEPLEAIEQPRLGRENVHDEVEVVEQNPLGSLVAFDMRRFDALGREGYRC